MSDLYLDIQAAFEIAITGAGIRYIDPSADISWPNSVFDPSEKDAWLNVNVFNADTSTEAKDVTGMIDTGFCQVDVFVPLNDKTGGIVQYNTRALQMVGDVKRTFLPTTRLSYGSVNLTVTETTDATPLISESWLQIPLTINYSRI